MLGIEPGPATCKSSALSCCPTIPAPEVLVLFPLLAPHSHHSVLLVSSPPMQQLGTMLSPTASQTSPAAQTTARVVGHSGPARLPQVRVVTQPSLPTTPQPSAGPTQAMPQMSPGSQIRAPTATTAQTKVVPQVSLGHRAQRAASGPAATCGTHDEHGGWPSSTCWDLGDRSPESQRESLNQWFFCGPTCHEPMALVRVFSLPHFPGLGKGMKFILGALHGEVLRKLSCSVHMGDWWVGVLICGR